MTTSSRGIALIFGILALALPGAVLAQENLDAGKTPAQLFHSDCVMCHKSTRGLSRGGGGIGGLEGFLREHYTASRESAAAIASYIRNTDRGPMPRHRRHTVRPRHKSADGKATAKPSAAKKVEKKAAKSATAKMTDKKTPDKKADQAAAGDKKSGKVKATDKKENKKKDEAMPAPKKPRPSKSAASKPSTPKTMKSEARASKPAATTGMPKDAKPVR